jgi:thiol-disulfide isomerase/thioredoxin
MTTVFYASYVALWLLVAVMAVLIILLYRHFGLAVMDSAAGHAHDGIAVGAKAPDLEGVGADGSAMSWRSGHDGAALVLFGSPGCEPCQQIIPHLDLLARKVAPEDLTVIGVVAGADGAAATMAEFGPDVRFFGESYEECSHDYEVTVTPFAFVIDADGRVQSKGLASDPSHLRRMLDVAGLQRLATLLAPTDDRPGSSAPISPDVLHIEARP